MRLVIPRTIATVSNSPRRNSRTLEEVAPADTSNSTSDIVVASATPTVKQQPISEKETVTTSTSLQPNDTLYMVRNNDTVEKLAERFKLPPKMIYAANKLHSYSVIHPGDQLIIPTHLASKATSEDLRKISPGDTLYMIRHGDTIETIAQKFKTTPSEIRIANLMVNNRLEEGEHLIVPTHESRGSNQGRSLPLKLTS